MGNAGTVELDSRLRPISLPRAEYRPVSGATFWLYIYFLVDYFLHFSARVPAYGKFRPTLLIVLIIAGLLWSQTDILRKRSTNAVFMSLLVFLGYLIVTLPFVQFPGSVLRFNLPAFIKAIVFFYFTAYIIDTPQRLRIFLGVFVFCQLFRAIEPLYMNLAFGYWGDSTYIGEGQMADRLAGAPADVVNPNGLGFVIATVIPYLHFLLLPRGFWGKVLYFTIIPALLYALILTMSRGAFIALIVVGAMIIKESKHKLLLAVTIVVLILGSWSVMNPVQKDRYLSLINKSDSAAATTKQGRIDGMINEIKVSFSRPIFGHGLGTTSEVKFHALGDTHASHNLYAEIMIETGILGAILFLRFLYFVIRSLQQLRAFLRSRRISHSSYPSRVVKALTTVFFMFAVYSLNYWGLSQSYWYLFAGLVFAFHRQVVLQAKLADIAAAKQATQAI